MRLQSSIMALCVGACLTLSAAEDDATFKAEVADLLNKSQIWLASQQQPNGAFAPGAKFAIGITGLAVDALQSAPAYYPEGSEQPKQAIDFLWSNQQPNGGVYVDELGNYGTALTMMAMDATGIKDADRTKRMQDYLWGIQNNTEGSFSYGGIGYGSRGEGHEDLSNTGMAIEGLRRSGVPASDPNLQKAMDFLERCQDLSSHNDQPWVQNTGGGVYTPDESKADGSWDPKTAKPGEKPTALQPYGGMTYQLISSYVALDLKPGDPRLDAAMAWALKHYQFDGNPGMLPGKERSGLFYYYMTMAKTFDNLGVKTLELPDGRTVDWRRDLFKAIKANSAPVTLPDGRECVIWINAQDRWAEGMPQVTAGYLVKSLKRIHESLE